MLKNWMIDKCFSFYFKLATLILKKNTFYLVIVLCTDELGLNLLPLFYEFKIAKLDEQQCIKEKRAAHTAMLVVHV